VNIPPHVRDAINARLRLGLAEVLEEQGVTLPDAYRAGPFYVDPVWRCHITRDEAFALAEERRLKAQPADDEDKAR
jgi:hypothetical protein